VKFLAENNLQFQTVSEEDERRLLESAPPYLRELILFAVNTGLRCGDLLDLKWEEVDIEEKRLSLIMGKTRRKLEIPLNDYRLEAGRINTTESRRGTAEAVLKVSG
jgi:integrase